MIVPLDDTGNFVHALVTSLPPGQNMLAYGSKISWAEFADIWGRVMGKQCRHEYMDATELENLVGEEMGKELGDMYRYADEFGYDGGDPSGNCAGSTWSSVCDCLDV